MSATYQPPGGGGAVVSVAGRTGVVVLTKTDVGLGNVDNTADASKPVSTAQQTALDLKQPVDSDLTAIAALSTTAFGRALLELADAAAGRTALGLGTAATQASGAFDAAGAAAAAQSASQPLDSDLTAIAALTTTSFGRAFLALADAAAARSAISLGNVDNTSDAGKPVSTAQQTALDLKANLASPVFTGNPTAPTPSAADSDTSIATTAFVQGEIAAKAPLASPALTGNPTAPTASVGDADTSIATTAFVTAAGAVVTANAQTGDYTLVLTDAGKSIDLSAATGKTVTIPPNSSVAFTVGTVVEVTQLGAGQVTIAAGGGVTLSEPDSHLKTAKQYAVVAARKVATDVWVLAGYTAA